MSGGFVQLRSWLVVAAGVSVLLLPIVLSYGAGPGLAGWSSFLSGIAVTAFALRAVEHGNLLTAWGTLLLGSWVMLSPFVLGFADQTFASACHIAAGLWIGGEGFINVRTI